MHRSVVAADASSATASGAPVIVPAGAIPTRYEAFAVLLANGDLPLSAAEHCENVIGEDAGPAPTLGQWIAYNLSVLEDGAITLPVRCTPHAAGWECDVEFSVRNDPDNVLWRWGVRFVLHRDGTFDRTSVVCTGAG
jgi:hypothetical protein